MTEDTKPRDTKISAFRELGRRSLSRDAATHLRDLILDGTLRPGERLPPERELAGRLGVSRPTLREAVTALVVMGLLESRHGAGTFVAAAEPDHGGTITIDIRQDTLESLFELRLQFEPAAASRAAARLDDEQLAELGEILEELRAQVADPETFVLVDERFHRAIHQVGGSSVSIAVLDAISELAWRSRTLSGSSRSVRERTVVEHHVILDALERHDPYEAAAAMTAHLNHIRAALIGQTT